MCKTSHVCTGMLVQFYSHRASSVAKLATPYTCTYIYTYIIELNKEILSKTQYTYRCIYVLSLYACMFICSKLVINTLHRYAWVVM